MLRLEWLVYSITKTMPQYTYHYTKST